jgi:hypothetical protein
MTDKFDTDDPHEVVASIARWGTSVTASGGQTKGIIDNFEAPRRPESELDRQLVAKTRWMKTTFERAVRRNGRRVDATTQFTTQASYTHGDADRAGAAAVRRRTGSA